MKKTVTFLLTALIAFPAYAATPIDETVDADGAALLTITNSVGSVTVTGTNGDQVEVTGSLGDSAEGLDVHRNGDQVVVSVVMPDRGDFRRAMEGTTLEIRAPRELAVEINTVSARIAVDGMRGDQELASVSGSIDTVFEGAEIEAMSVSGRIHIEGGEDAARAEVSSVSGNVDLDAMTGEVIAQTVSGRIELESPGLDRGDLQSVSGNIDIDTALEANARLHAVTTSGRITLNLRGNGEGRYELSTFSGRIDNCFGPEPERAQFGPPSSTIRFTEGDTDVRVEVNSMSGDIELCRSR